jgi:hypothetical protein
MPNLPVDPRIVEYYRDEYCEDDLLRRPVIGQVELPRTQELLRRHLPPAPAEVIDVGGAPPS